MSIAKTDPKNDFFVKFLDDYFAECDEHLTLIRKHLLALEPFINQPQIDRSLIDELFRSFHSLKGISGMVGLTEAEQIAHQTESYLRRLREDQVILTSEALETLIAGTHMLEEVIAGHRDQTPKTEIAPVLARLEKLLAGGSTRDSVSDVSGKHAVTELSIAENERVARALQLGSKVWRFEFVPSASLSERGVNVNNLRSRLQEIGELIHAAPRVLEQGAIAFEFLLATNVDEVSFASLLGDGLTYTAFESALPILSSVVDELPRASQSPTSRSFSNVVRVDLGRLDDLMRMIGELTISRSRLDDHLTHLESGMAALEWRPLQEINQVMERELRALREGVMRVRMVPFSEIFERMRFVVRDLARENKKKIDLELIGEETEIDKFLVERMMDPILHLVRNAISHGLETPGEREAQGKSPVGTLTLRASTVAETVMLEIADNGRGIDGGHIARHAKAMGLVDQPSSFSTSTILDLICTAGFSTREETDRAAGRGVGMAVVRNTVLSLGGSLNMDTEVGRGTSFSIQLPLTLAVADALIVSVDGQRFAVPQSTISEVIEVESSAVKAFEKNEIIQHREGVLPLIRLAKLFGLKENAPAYFHAFVVGRESNAVGIAVDRILGQREIVVRAINDPLIQVPGIAGATELGDGHIILILNPGDFTRSATELRVRPESNTDAQL